MSHILPVTILNSMADLKTLLKDDYQGAMPAMARVTLKV